MGTEQSGQHVSRWVREFEDAQPRYKALEDAAVDDLKRVIAHNGLLERVHSIRHRVKTVASFREKIERKSYSHPLNDMRDLVGIRVVCLYPSILNDIDAIIRGCFDVVRYEDKRKGESPELWRYSSIHYDCRVPEAHRGPRYDQIKDMIFEIQVRTILQDAWATVEHKLGYKNEKSIPDELKREFSALAGLFHIADQSFQHIANEVRLSEQSARDTVDELVNLYQEAEEAQVKPAHAERVAAIDNMITRLETSTDISIDRSTVKALLRNIFNSRKQATDYEYSEIVEELALANVTSLKALRELLHNGHGRAVGLEKRHPEYEAGRRLNDVGFTRLALSMASPEFQEIRRRRQEDAEEEL